MKANGRQIKKNGGSKSLFFKYWHLLYDELMLQEARSSSSRNISPANFNHSGAVDAQPVSKQYVSLSMFGLTIVPPLSQYLDLSFLFEI
jgi:hypothetical protein